MLVVVVVGLESFLWKEEENSISIMMTYIIIVHCIYKEKIRSSLFHHNDWLQERNRKWKWKFSYIFI